MTKKHYHAAIWIDDREARVFHFGLTDIETLVLHSDNLTRHIHHKANSIGSGHEPTSPDYLRAIAESVSDAGSVLITGPPVQRPNWPSLFACTTPGLQG